MDALQASVAALGMFYPGRNVQDIENNYWSAVRLVAKLPTLVAAWARLRQGNDYIPPRDDLGFSENFLYMLTETEPLPLWADLFDDCLILHAEHTMNASTFTGMVTASTLADPYTVVASSIGALKGPLHGGANEEVVQMLEEIGRPEKVRSYLEEQIRTKQRLMGFGHRVYKVKDPRATVLQGLCEQLFTESGSSPSMKLPSKSRGLRQTCYKERGFIPTSISTQESSTRRWVSKPISSHRSSQWPGSPDGWPIGWSNCAKINCSARTRFTPANMADPTCRSNSANSPLTLPQQGLPPSSDRRIGARRPYTTENNDWDYKGGLYDTRTVGSVS